MMDPVDDASVLLEVRNLEVKFRTERGVIRAVDGVDLRVGRGEIVAVVGESGSGKSVTAMTLMGLTRARGAEIQGEALFDGKDLLTSSDDELNRVRGSKMALVCQDPMSAWHPLYRIGDQIVEQIRAHTSMSRADAFAEAISAMQRAGIPHARLRAQNYPHELSGGLRQRAMLAMALSCSPELLIADEPTTALDVTIQAQILAEIRGMRARAGVSVILVTHDLAVVAQTADRVCVMYGGRIVEEAPTRAIFEHPQHPYTWGLLGCMMRADDVTRRRLTAIPGSTPSLATPPVGCHFAPRCNYRHAACRTVPPLRSAIGGNPKHRDRCWLSPSDKATKGRTRATRDPGP